MEQVKITIKRTTAKVKTRFEVELNYNFRRSSQFIFTFLITVVKFHLSKCHFKRGGGRDQG